MDDTAADPCWHCAVRADLGCRHHEPHGGLPPALRRKAYRPDRRSYVGQGYNFGKAERSRELARALQRTRMALR